MEHSVPLGGSRDAFLDAVRLWRIAPVIYKREVIASAADCLASGFDSTGLVDLAGSSMEDVSEEIAPRVLLAIEELGASDELTEECYLDALKAMARKVRRGEVSIRDFAFWSRSFLPVDGEQDFLTLVYACDLYDDAGNSVEEIEYADSLARGVAFSLGD